MCQGVSSIAANVDRPLEERLKISCMVRCQTTLKGLDTCNEFCGFIEHVLKPEHFDHLQDLYVKNKNDYAPLVLYNYIFLSFNPHSLVGIRNSGDCTFEV